MDGCALGIEPTCLWNPINPMASWSSRQRNLWKAMDELGLGWEDADWDCLEVRQRQPRIRYAGWRLQKSDNSERYSSSSFSSGRKHAYEESDFLGILPVSIVYFANMTSLIFIWWDNIVGQSLGSASPHYQDHGSGTNWEIQTDSSFCDCYWV